MKATLLSNTNEDLTVVNSARVSFNKKSERVTDRDIRLINFLALNDHFTPFTHNFHVFEIPIKDPLSYQELAFDFFDYFVSKSNMAGIKIRGGTNSLIVGTNVYRLACDLHEMPFAYSMLSHVQESMPHSVKALYTPVMSQKLDSVIPVKHTDDARFLFDTFSLKVPFFVARQLDKHQVGFTRNEVSRRYVDEEPEFYRIKEWRKKAEDKKQGSSDELVEKLENFDEEDILSLFYEGLSPSEFVDKSLLDSEYVYQVLLDRLVCPEQARAVLPMSTYTEYWLSACLEDWNRLLMLRLKNDTQKETREVAAMIRDQLTAKYGKNSVYTDDGYF